ncbi:MAG: IPTL-CTERM sorting domain-containing protein [Chitinophagales bacterium]|nr:IPTL-CTERM sorting domain-containing protein [Chitinophagales bacterium]
MDTGANGKIFIAGLNNSAAAIICINANGTLNYAVNEPFIGNPNLLSIFYTAVYYAVVVQPDGKAICWGARNYSGSCGCGVNTYISRRYNTNGTFDNTFNPGLGYGTPPITTGGEAKGILQSDGKAVFCYRACTPAGCPNNDLYLTRLNLDGSLDNTFGTGSYTATGFAQPCVSSNDVIAFRKISGDKMRIGGTIGGCGTTGNIIGKVKQFTSNGLTDNSFDTGGVVTLQHSTSQTWIYDIVVDMATDKTYAIGVAALGGLIYRLNSNGTLDNTFNSTGKVGPFNTFNNGMFNTGGFERGGLYSANRILVSFTHGPDPNMRGVVHTVIDQTNAQLTIAATPDCANNQIVLNVNDQNLSCYTYQWYKDGVAISGATSTSYNATANGNYYVSGSYLPPPTGAAGLPPGTTNSNALAIDVSVLCNNPIPTLSEWGLIIFALLLLCIGAVAVWKARYGKAYGKAGV